MSILAARRGVVAKLVGGGVGPQFARPSSVVSIGGWTVTGAANGAAAINEATASDAEYINTGSATTDIAKFALSAITAPTDFTGHVIRVRAKTSSGGAIYAELRNTGGGTVWYPSTAIGTLTGSFTDFTLALSTAQASAITGYNALELWISGQPAALNNVSVSHAYLGVN